MTFLSFIYDDNIGYVGDLSSMKILLSLIICSQVQQTCLEPIHGLKPLIINMTV